MRPANDYCWLITASQNITATVEHSRSCWEGVQLHTLASSTSISAETEEACSSAGSPGFCQTPQMVQGRTQGLWSNVNTYKLLVVRVPGQITDWTQRLFIGLMENRRTESGVLCGGVVTTWSMDWTSGWSAIHFTQSPVLFQCHF